MDITVVASPLFFMFMQRRIRVAREEAGVELIVPLTIPGIIPVFLLKFFA